MTGRVSKDHTEYDLETAISAAIEATFPRLGAAGIKHQIEFSIRLGHATITAKGRESWIRRGRADILLTIESKPLAILELKKRGVALTTDDGEQGISYARLLPIMAPFVVVTNGNETRIIETFSGQPYTGETPDAKSFEALMLSAARVAAGDRDNAIATLMGSDPQVWTSAVAAASARAVNELTATPDHPLRPFGPLKILRLATRQLAHKLRTSRLVLISGPPLAGKTNILEQLVRLIDPQVAGGLFLECGASEVFRKISDLLADTLDWPVDPEAARAWVRQLSRAGGPALVLAIDRLDPEDHDDVRMIEDLTSNTFGPALRVVVGLDTDATRRALTSADGRRESPIGRRAAIVEVEDLAEPEYFIALKALAELNMGIMALGNVHAWLILSQLASRRFVAEGNGSQRRLDLETLLLVGTADFVLRQPRNDILMDSVPVHDSDEGGQFVCHNAGVVEAVTQSILRYLSNEPREDRDTFVAAAMDIDSIYLTARLDIALRMLTRSTDADLAAWASEVLTNTVRPAFLRHAQDH